MWLALWTHSPHWHTILISLDLQENLFFPSFSLKSKFIHELRQTYIFIIISIIFATGHCNRVHLFGIHDIDALIWQENLFFPSFSLLLKFIREMRQTLIHIIIFILFVIGTTIMFTLLGYMMLMLWFDRKSFSFHHFPCNQSLSVKWNKPRYS